MLPFTIRPLTAADRDWVRALIVERWGAGFVIAHGTVYHPHELPGFAAERGAERAGLLTIHISGGACEIVTLDSLRPGEGIGAALVEAAAQAARAAGCTRLWVVTTNDNLNALRFYQKRGFRLSALRPGAVDESRRLKPSIPLTGEHGIPIRDEIELELALGDG
jgi:GNAT superfamily N-acetyltransferase